MGMVQMSEPWFTLLLVGMAFVNAAAILLTLWLAAKLFK